MTAQQTCSRGDWVFLCHKDRQQMVTRTCAEYHCVTAYLAHLQVATQHSIVARQIMLDLMTYTLYSIGIRRFGIRRH